MALSQPRVYFGIHSFTPYSRTTGQPYGILKVLQGSTIALEAEQVDLMGGSSQYPWASENSTISADISLKTSQYENFMYELFLGKAPTDNAAETAGSVTTITNKSGTSVVAATGIASVGLKSGSSSSVKFGKYVVVAASTTTVDVYCMSDVDAGRGTNFTYQNDGLKITASALTITQSAAVEIPGTGLELTGGAGVIGMTAAHTATFTSRPINDDSADVIIGSSSDTVFPEFGAVILTQKLGNGQMLEIDAYRCKAAGMGHPFEYGAFSQTEVNVKMLYDSTLDGVFAKRWVKPTTA